MTRVFVPEPYHEPEKRSSDCAVCGRILLGVCFLSSVIALSMSWIIAAGVPDFSTSKDDLETYKNYKQPRRLDTKTDINALKQSFQFVAKNLKISEDSLVDILQDKIEEKRRYERKTLSEKSLHLASVPIFTPNIKPKITFSTTNPSHVRTSLSTVAASIKTSSTEKSTTSAKDFSDSKAENLETTTKESSKIKGDREISKWEGNFHYPGYGIFSIGKYDEPFHVNITRTKDGMKGTGQDSQGIFKFEGDLHKWKKIYNSRLCSDILYEADSVKKKKIAGSVSFTDCSTAKYVAENPGLAAFAPSKSSGSGTFSMTCKEHCDQVTNNDDV